jgi:hypothetical protein
LNGTGIVGGFLSTLTPSFGGSKIFGFKALAFTCSLEDEHTFQYYFLVSSPLVCIYELLMHPALLQAKPTPSWHIIVQLYHYSKEYIMQE